MKIYHKFLLYQNKLLKPYVRILLGLVEALTYLASPKMKELGLSLLTIFWATFAVVGTQLTAAIPMTGL